MADEANNGIPDVDKSPESTENEVKSPIVMRIDAPDSAPSVDPEPPAFSFSGARDFSSRGLPYREFPAVHSPTRVFTSSNSTNRAFPGISGCRPGPFGGGIFGQSAVTAPASPRQPLLRPSSLAVSSDVSSSEPDEGVAAATASAEQRMDERDDAASSTVATATTTTAPPVKFVPLGGAVPKHKDDSGVVGGSGVSSSVTGFVFGQNLHARAVAADAPDSTSAGGAAGSAKPVQVATSNGTAPTEMLFTSVIQSEPLAADSSGGASGPSGSSASGESGASGGAAEGKSLSEAAAEYEESRAVKRTYQRVALFTGEEDEDNVQQVICKLFAYDGGTGQYVERGHGTLRLNDRDSPDGTHSRVVMRSAGSLRVILNTKVWPGMLVDRASPKSVRITAMEAPGQIKVFLVMASRKEIDGLCSSLQTRVANLRAADDGPTTTDDEPTTTEDEAATPDDELAAASRPAKRCRTSDSNSDSGSDSNSIPVSNSNSNPISPNQGDQ